MNSLSALVALALFVTLSASASASRSAALCCAMANKCDKKLASRSACMPFTWTSAQPKACLNAACKFCATYPKSKPCRSMPIKKNCNKSGPPSPPSPGGKCNLFYGKDGKVIIPMSRVATKGKWVRTSDAIVWNPSFNKGSVIPPKSSEAICVDYVPDRTGSYYFTIVSKAPHPTEHNDAWFQFGKIPIILSRPRTRSTKEKSGGIWFKGYQNRGRNEYADYVVTIDFNGHQFIMKKLEAGKRYTVCMAGRSSKFTVKSFMFINCSGLVGCDRFAPGIMRAVKNAVPSKCK